MIFQHKKGKSLNNGEAHQQAHKAWSRRNFLSTMGLAGTGSLLLAGSSVKAFTSPLSSALNNSSSDQILVLIRLGGGNDSLNTIIPTYQYNHYNARRPNIAIPESDIVDLGEGMGMPNTMESLLPLWQNGNMKVIHNVGYANQNHSHFHSQKIWASSDLSGAEGSGWMGRYLENEFPDYLLNPPDSPPAIQVGAANHIFNSSSGDASFVVNDISQLEQIGNSGEAFDLSNLPPCLYGEELGFVRSMTNATMSYSEAIYSAYNEGTTAPSANYPEEVPWFNQFMGEKMKLVARLIKGNIGTKVFMIDMPFFDTHETQSGIHPYLMEDLAKSISAFYDDLAASNMDQKVLTMTLSEFGREIDENGSNGTDHGAAASMLLFGGAVNGGGFVGTQPDISDPNLPDLPYEFDFRNIYATILQDWLCVDSNIIDNMLLSQGLNPISSIINGSCAASFSGVLLAHNTQKENQHLIDIKYVMPNTANVKIELLSASGQAIMTMVDTQKSAGTHVFTLDKQAQNISSGDYLYRLQTNGQSYIRKVQLF